tara:strand:- start:4779 stop:4967 length:189 start_codon:yes stop_codon:yes gene_type:complete
VGGQDSLHVLHWFRNVALVVELHQQRLVLYRAPPLLGLLLQQHLLQHAIPLKCKRLILWDSQ